jgi:hypothetical protein
MVIFVLFFYFMFFYFYFFNFFLNFKIGKDKFGFLLIDKNYYSYASYSLSIWYFHLFVFILLVTYLYLFILPLLIMFDYNVIPKIPVIFISYFIYLVTFGNFILLFLNDRYLYRFSNIKIIEVFWLFNLIGLLLIYIYGFSYLLYISFMVFLFILYVFLLGFYKEDKYDVWYLYDKVDMLDSSNIQSSSFFTRIIKPKT